MPTDLTIFTASYLAYIDVLLALLILAWLLIAKPRAVGLKWLVTVGLLVVLSFIFAKIGASVYTDPRPFTIDHVKPLISHAADNGFPSDHALLVAALVAAVLLVSPMWSIPFIVLAVLVDWARVGAGIHHVQDVLGSSLFVLVATLIAIALAPTITRIVLPYVPPALMAEPRNRGEQTARAR